MIVGVPCVMLVLLGSQIVQAAAGAMPRFKSWVQGRVRALLGEIGLDEIMQRSQHFKTFKEKIGRAETVGIMHSTKNSHLFDLYSAGMGIGHAKPEVLSWPYQEGRGSGRARAKMLSEHLGAIQRYREMGSEDEEGDEDGFEEDGDDGF